MNFDNQIALITGAAQGIGRATAIGFAKLGASVALVDRDGEGVKAVASEIQAIGAKALALTADVSKASEVRGYAQAAREEFGRIDCFFNNAGIEGVVSPIIDYDEEVFDAVLSVNVKGVFHGMKYVLPVMTEQGSGAVVNTASIAGLVGTPGMSAYVASKHAVLGMTKVAAGEVARSAVRVNAVCPGPIDTRMTRDLARSIMPDDPDTVVKNYSAAIPLGRYGTAEEVAQMVLFLSSSLASNITGAHFVVDGGRTAVPAALTDVVTICVAASASGSKRALSSHTGNARLHCRCVLAW